MAVRWLTAFIDLPAPVFEDGCTFWAAVTGYTLSARRGHNDQFVTLLPEKGDAFLRLQRLDEGPVGCHLDLHVDDVATTCQEATSLGASVRHDHGSYVVLASPAGLSFCIVAHRGEAERPKSRPWAGGHRSFVDQLCIDIAPDDYEREAVFWTALTGWARGSGCGCGPTLSDPFEYLERPPEIPLRLLLQRLDDEEPGHGRAHLDLSCDGVLSEPQRHQALGAKVVRMTSDWTTLLGPAGDEYCVTRRNPDSGLLE